MGTRVFIGRIPYRATERDVEHFFRGYGRISEVMLKNGYGFVEFSDYRDADDAVHDLNQRDFMGERVNVELARGTPHGRDRERLGYGRESGGGGGGGGGYRGGDYGGRSNYHGGGGGRSRGPPSRRREGNRTERTEYRLIVENLSSRVSWQDLKDFMRQAGEVTYTDAHGKRKNEGLVEFATKADMKTALEKLDGKDLNGRKIKLVEESKRSARGSKSKSRSRSQSRSRSKSADKRSGGSRSRSGSKEKDGAKSDEDGENGGDDEKKNESRGSESPAHENGENGDSSRKKRARSRSGSEDGRDGSGSPAAKRERDDDVNESKEGNDADEDGDSGNE